MGLVLVGRKDYFYQQLEKETQKYDFRNIIFTGYIPDNELNVVYQNAELYLFPSLYEGFGLPPLEAMKKRLPVLSSNHQCMREIFLCTQR